MAPPCCSLAASDRRIERGSGSLALALSLSLPLSLSLSFSLSFRTLIHACSILFRAHSDMFLRGQFGVPQDYTMANYHLERGAEAISPVPFGHVSSFFLGGRGQQSPFPPGRLQAQREERLPDGPKLSTESGETLLAASWRASAIEFSLQDKKAAARHFKIAGEARLSSFHHWSNCFSPCVRATSQGKMG